MKEARWLPLVGPQLPAAVPEIVAIGEPGFGYPEHWSLVRWIDGETPAVVSGRPSAGSDRIGLAHDLAAFVRALGELDVPDGALDDPELRWYRGDALAKRDAPTREALDACRSIEGLAVDLDGALRIWEDALALQALARSPP
jgi:aminoglycoside phosphotransferase (APT) family kinase protein